MIIIYCYLKVIQRHCKKFFKLILNIVYIYASLSLILKNYNFVSDGIVVIANSRQSSWVVGLNSPYWSILWEKLVSNVFLVKESHAMKIRYIDDDATIVPDFFDARKQWPKCKSIGQVWDQGMGSSGWAISATSVLADRICIDLNQIDNPILSPEDLISCCTKCRFGSKEGGPNLAWEYLEKFGVTTGGPYGSRIGCKSYSQQPCSHNINATSQYEPCSSTEPEIGQCYKICDADSKDSYEDNLYYAQHPYIVYPLERQIKLEIMKNGPVQATFSFQEDFLNYQNGTYNGDDKSSHHFGEQSAKLIGWGIDDQNQSYWLAVNSWNSEWGENGIFKWRINQSENDLESRVYAASPRIY